MISNIEKSTVIGKSASPEASANLDKVYGLLFDEQFAFEFEAPSNAQDPKWVKHEDVDDESFRSMRIWGSLQVKFMADGKMICRFDATEANNAPFNTQE